MNTQEAFKKGLETIRRLAGENGGAVTVSEILQAFPGVDLDEDQIGEIYDYLERENITLKDYVPHDTRTLDLTGEEAEDALSEEDRKMLDFYLEDLEAVLPLTGGEIEALAAQLVGRDEDAREAARLRLTEGNLHYAVILAREFAGKGVPLVDLIQEANLGLMESLDAYGAGDGDLEDWLEKGARKALRAIVKEEEGFARMQEDMTNAANRVLEAVKEQEAEEGRALSAEELAERLGMPVSRVEAVLKESAKAIRNAEK
jgi:RNA polymerase primary sigma factor